MPEVDSYYHYIAYAVIIVVFFLVLKLPKRKD